MVFVVECRIYIQSHRCGSTECVENIYVLLLRLVLALCLPLAIRMQQQTDIATKEATCTLCLSSASGVTERGVSRCRPAHTVHNNKKSLNNGGASRRGALQGSFSHCLGLLQDPLRCCYIAVPRTGRAPKQTRHVKPVEEG